MGKISGVRKDIVRAMSGSKMYKPPRVAAKAAPSVAATGAGSTALGVGYVAANQPRRKK